MLNQLDGLAGQRLVGVFPHPDDEAYAAGGLLYLCARAGASVSVVCATRGDAGRARSPDAVARPLGERRAAELAASCRALGVGPPTFLGVADGQVAHAGDAIVEVLADLFEDLRPHAIVTLGTDGVYGHRDHTACTALVARAAMRAAPDVRVLHTQFPAGLFAPLRRALRKRRAAAIDPAVGADDLGTRADAVDLRVPIASARDAKLAAIAAHASQLEGGDPRTFLLPGIVDALLDEEWYTLAAGPALPPGAAHPFA